jgi:hypothetical protein
MIGGPPGRAERSDWWRQRGSSELILNWSTMFTPPPVLIILTVCRRPTLRGAEQGQGIKAGAPHWNDLAPCTNRRAGPPLEPGSDAALAAGLIL